MRLDVSSIALELSNQGDVFLAMVSVVGLGTQEEDVNLFLRRSEAQA